MNQSPHSAIAQTEGIISEPARSSAAASLSAADIQAWMVSKLAEAMKVGSSEIDVQLPFIDYGLESIVLFTLTGDLADWLNQDLPATLLWEYPTVETLSRYLAEHLPVQHSHTDS